MLDRKEVVSVIWNRLLHRKNSPYKITEIEQEWFISEINNLLDKGWTSWEIINYLCWTEDFNTGDSEEVCLRKMSEMAKFVETRLNTTKTYAKGSSQRTFHGFLVLVLQLKQTDVGATYYGPCTDVKT